MTGSDHNVHNIQKESGAAAKLPRLAMLNSMAGFGSISTAVSLPVISAMAVRVSPIPTSVLSNHLAFPACSFYDYTPHIPDYIRAWKELSLSFDGFYCGFLGNREQISIAEDFLNHFRPPFFLLDPVMGDYGKAYSTITAEHCDALKKLLAYAQLITPNITEACLLTDTPYTGDAPTDTELEQLCEKLSALCPGKIVITGLHRNGLLLNYIHENGKSCVYSVADAGSPRHGTGDLFASILAANALHQKELYSSVKQAADFVALCIREADKMGLPPKEGVPFEKFLSLLY